MFFTSYISFFGAFLCCCLAAYSLIRDPHSFVHRTFAVGMIVLALEEVFIGLSAEAVLSSEVIRWQYLKVLATAFSLGSWLLFSLSFARTNYKEFLEKWKWIALGVFALPLALVTVFGDSLFAGTSAPDEFFGWLIPLGWSGYAFHISLLLGSVLILMNLERTLRVFTGSMQWQIKFMVLGIGGLFAVNIYTSSQALLFSSVNTTLDLVRSAALIVAAVLVIVSFVRLRILNVDLYLSQTFLYNSITVLVVGIYLLVVGVLSKAVTNIGGIQAIPLNALLVFLALLVLSIILLSDQLRQQLKRFIYRSFHLPRYDYRKEWMAFTRGATLLVDMKDLCPAVVKMVSETFGVPSVTLWLLDTTQDQLVLGGSTVFPVGQAHGLISARGAADLVRVMQDQQMPVDFDGPATDWARELKRSNPDYFREARIRYCVSLIASGEVLGLITLDERLTKEPFSVEDFDLLKTMADQTAGSLLNLKLFEQLSRAKEMEAFQTLSAFFVHDLKNLASTLSLTMQNLTIHFDNPAFRTDALRTISQSVNKMNALSNHLSTLRQNPELRLTEADLNELVTDTLTNLNGCHKALPIQDLRPLPRVVMDLEQVQKVLVNLVLNANEAVGDRGEIHVTTEQRDGWVVLSISDNGCGMSKEFIARSLFQPFQTTKKGGLGIGLFQSRRIVEAHKGRIEVESEEGKGSTFRVMLPTQELRAKGLGLRTKSQKSNH